MEGMQEATCPHKGKRHSAEFRANIVRLVKVDGMCVADVSRQSGVRANQIYRWIKKLKLLEARQDPASNEAKDLELTRLQRENQYLKKQVDFLKKAAAYFAHENMNSTSAFEIAPPESLK